MRERDSGGKPDANGMNASAEPRNDAMSAIVGESPLLRRVLEAVKRVAETNATVLIRGESGTGKELIARAIHYSSRRKEHPFVTLNCAALPEALIETELFGHDKGAFTGAVADHPGLFELSHKGTLFLDEIGSITPLVQAKLLRVLQERTYQRVGGLKQISADVRLIASTNENLEKKVDSGDFREDLYYRINVFPIHVPPLRARIEDIHPLIEHFIKGFCAQNSIAPKTIAADALEMMRSYPWRGNVRELENVVHRMLLMIDQEVITSKHLCAYLPDSVSASSTFAESGELALDRDGAGFDQLVENFELHLIQSALDRAKGLKTKAAELLKIDRSRMNYLCRKHKI